MKRIPIQPISKNAFVPFGEIIDTHGAPDNIINQGLCARYHDRATLRAQNGRLGLSLFQGEPRQLPLKLDMVERHPLGSQCFIPMSMTPFLIIVAPDNAGTPGTPLAFQTEPGQAINLHQGTWHGVLTPLEPPALYAVIDRIGADENLEEYWFNAPFEVAAS